MLGDARGIFRGMSIDRSIPAHNNPEKINARQSDGVTGAGAVPGDCKNIVILSLQLFQTLTMWPPVIPFIMQPDIWKHFMCGFLPTGGQRKTWAALSQECWRSLQLDDVIQEKSCNSAWRKNGVQGTPRRLVNKLSWIWGPVEWEDTRECAMHNVKYYISYISFITKFLASLCFRLYASYRVIWEKAMIFEFSHICYICCMGRKFLEICQEYWENMSPKNIYLKMEKLQTLLRLSFLVVANIEVCPQGGLWLCRWYSECLPKSFTHIAGWQNRLFHLESKAVNRIEVLWVAV